MIKNEKSLLAIYIGWAFLHLIFLTMGWNGYHHKDNFWVFSSVPYGFKESYDLSEFLFYVGSPIVIFVIYKILKKEPIK